jgi:hypothetical protein
MANKKSRKTLVSEMQSTLTELINLEVEFSEYLNVISLQLKENQDILTAFRGQILKMSVKLQALKGGTIIL